MRKILIPIDFSQPAESVIDFVRPVAAEFNAALHLVYVLPPDEHLTALLDSPARLSDPTIGRHLRQRLKALSKKHSIDCSEANLHVLKGRPFEQICALAARLEIDLIVTATRGNTGLKHLLLGSTADRVIRYSPCPVVVVQPEILRSKRALNFGNLLVPVDFSTCSMIGLNEAIRLADRFGSKVLLLSSVAPQYFVTSDEYARYDFPELLRETEIILRHQMRDLVAKTGSNGRQIDGIIDIGHPGQQICARAGELKTDVIVLSTHGKTGFKHVLLGSTAEYVARHAECPVLVVPSHQRPQLNRSVKEL